MEEKDVNMALSEYTDRRGKTVIIWNGTESKLLHDVTHSCIKID